jgi:hypothetical protein
MLTSTTLLLVQLGFRTVREPTTSYNSFHHFCIFASSGYVKDNVYATIESLLKYPAMLSASFKSKMTYFY